MYVCMQQLKLITLIESIKINSYLLDTAIHYLFSKVHLSKGSTHWKGELFFAYNYISFKKNSTISINNYLIFLQGFTKKNFVEINKVIH